MRFSDYIVYADESGDPNPASVDADYPVFVLNFCVFRKDEYASSVLPAVTAFKFAHFGHDMEVMHEHDIRRRNPPFTFLQNERNRVAFMTGLNDIIGKANFTVIPGVIDKRRLTEQCTEPSKPYELAFGLCLEQTYRFLESRSQHSSVTHIVLERRSNQQDKELEQAFRLIQSGANRLNQPLTGFEIAFADKKTNSAGLQIADLTARPIGRHYIAPEQPNRAWDLLASKLFRRPEAGSNDHGLTVLPETQKGKAPE